jgi:hypothetical protein
MMAGVTSPAILTYADCSSLRRITPKRLVAAIAG